MSARWTTLQDRHVLITGGSRGLGLALAHACAERGARLALLARDEHALRMARDQLRARCAHEVELLVCDLRNRSELEASVGQLLARWGRLDVLINNAGIIEPGAAEHKTIGDYEQAMAVHFWAPLHAMRAAIPGMRAQGGGRIVNVSALEGKVAFPFIAPYSASKYALTGLSNALRAELAREDIYVTTVVPGLMCAARGQDAPSKLPRWLARAAALPGVSTRYEQAAQRIVRALLKGRRWVELDLLSRILMRADALAPDLLGALMERVSRAAHRWGCK